MAVGAVELGQVGRHAAVGDRGRVSSACSNARLTQRSSTVLFHDGSCWRGEAAQPPSRPSGALDLRRVGDGLVVRAPRDDRRVVPEQVHRLAGLAHGLPADRAGVAPLQREVLPQQHAELVGGVVQLGAGDVACTRSRSRPASTASSTSRRTSSGVASARPGRVGSRLAPLRNSRSPLTEQIQSLNATSRRPVRRDRRSLELAVDEHLDVDVGQRLVAEAPRPPQPRLVDVEGPLDLVHAGGERVLALADDVAVDGRAHARRCGDVGVEPGRAGGGGPRCSSASRHSTRSGRCAPGRCRRRAPVRQSPPGFQSGRSRRSAGARR